MGFPYGADEDAAFMATWLELHKLGGISPHLGHFMWNSPKLCGFLGHFR